MDKLEIDYSHLPAPSGVEASRWRQPRHVFFGKKLEDGSMEEEPQYVHQAFPSLRYRLDGQKITAMQVETQEEADQLGDEWKDTPAAFGYVGAPSFEQVAAMKSGVVLEAPKRGRPPKNV